MIKSVRQKKMVEIIRSQPVETQEHLVAALGTEGFSVTQATVSRDIKDLGLIKVPGPKNTSIYALPRESPTTSAEARLRRLLVESAQKIEYSENLIVIKTFPGEAQGVASAIDNSGWPAIIGTVAGDDTIIVVIKPKEAVEKLLKRFKEISGG